MPTNKKTSMGNKADMWSGASSNAKAQNAAKSATGKSGKTAMTAKGKEINMNTEFAQEMCKLSDKDIISDVLASHKSLVKLYGTAIVESSCDKMRSLLNGKMSECAKDQFDVFLYMNQRNLYPTENAQASKLNQAKKKYDKIEQQMKK